VKSLLNNLNAPRRSEGSRVNGPNSWALPAPDYVDARVLAAGVEETHTVPADADVVIFSATDDFYVNYDATAAAPSGDVTDGSASELNPVVRDLAGVTTMHVIAPATCTITMSFYSYPSGDPRIA